MHVLHGFLKSAPFTHFAEVMSWNRVYCLFPISTILKKETYVLTCIDSLPSQAMETSLKWCAQVGFKTKLSHWNDSFAPRRHPAGKTPKSLRALVEPRRIGDNHSWILQLDTDGVVPPPNATARTAALANSSFILAKSNPRPQDRYAHYRYSIALLVSPVLRHTYMRPAYPLPAIPTVIPQFNEKNGPWIELEAQLHGLTVMELSKLDLAKRPSEYHRVCREPHRGSELLKGWVPPCGWTYYDDDMVEFMEWIQM